MKGKTKVNRKILLGVSAFACMIGITALCSFFPFIIDPSRWQTQEFISDELIVTAIAIFSIVAMMMISQAFNAQSPESNIARANVHFADVRAKVKAKGDSSFEQWVRKSLQPNDMKTEKETILLSAGLNDLSVIGLEDNEIKALIDTPQKYNGVFYKGITKKQYKEVLRAKRFTMPLVAPNYYLTSKGIMSQATISKKSGKETNKKAAILTWSIFSKVAMSVVMAMIFTSLVLDLSQGGVDQATAWMKFLSRMFSMVTSSFLGWMVGTQINDIDADFAEMKAEAQSRFLADASFVALTQQEEAKQEFAERVKKENVLMIGGK